MRERLIAGLGFILGCGGTAAPTPIVGGAPATVAKAAPTPPGLRLATDVTPKKYTLDLVLDPARTDFDGTVDIDVDVKTPSQLIWLHAQGLTVKSASVGDRPARVLQPDEDHLGLALDAPASGATRLHIVYSAKFSANETRGFFREESGGDAYVFSHFESTHARRAYPCFDEPSWKAPFALTMHIPANLTGLENMPVASETVEGATKTVKFVDTPPLPTYLFALGVGPFEMVDGGKTKSGVPVRVAAPRGRGAEAAWAAKVTAPLLDVEEDYFGQKYPFAKLDILSVPQSTEFGAEENPGLITVVEALALNSPDKPSEALQHIYASVMAHELAHMWFGDSVTPPWWNDIWLNESFASWMAPKIIRRWQPTWGAEVTMVENRNTALGADVLKSARAIRQPIASPADISNAFDGISYSKGEAVLTMFEAWIGEDKFQAGVRKYLEDKAYGSGSTEDFLAAIGAAAGRDVVAPFATFIDQAGVPLVTMKLTCAKGKPPVLALAQRRHVLAGIEPDARTWQIPICVRTDAKKTVCTLMTEATAELPLEGACPAWIEPNANARGYYRSLLDGDLGARLAKNAKKLSDPERLGSLSDLVSLAGAGVVPAADLLAALPSYGVTDNASIADVAINYLEVLHANLLPAGAEADFAKLVDRLFGARARALGFENKKGDDYEAKRLRLSIVTEVAMRTGDAKLLAEARRLADRWLADHKAIDPDLGFTALTVAAARGDKATADRLIQSLNATTDVGDRRRLIGALGSVRDPAAVDAVLALTLDEKIDIRESSGVFGDMAFAAETRDRVRAFIHDRWDALVARYPANFVIGLMRDASSVCDDAGKKDFEAFFKEKAQKMEGGPRVFDSQVERIRGCIAVKTIQGPSVAAYFKK